MAAPQNTRPTRTSSDVAYDLQITCRQRALRIAAARVAAVVLCAAAAAWMVIA